MAKKRIVETTVEVPSREEIDAYLEFERQRKEAQRLVDTIERQAKPLKEKLRAYVEANGGVDRTTVRCGVVIALRARGGVPKWKDEFIAVAGAQAAIEIQAKTPPIYLLVVEPTAQSEPTKA